MNIHEFLLKAHLDVAELEAWLAAGWLAPQQNKEVQFFSDMDVARAQFIHDLKHDLGVNDEGVTVVLDVVDQLYGLRRTMRKFLWAIHAQPESLRSEVLFEMSEVLQWSADDSNGQFRGNERQPSSRA